MRKVCVVVTARASYPKIKPILRGIQAKEGLSLQIICAGSALLHRFGRMDHIMEADGFPVQERLYTVIEGENLFTSAKSAGLAMMEFADAYQRLKPDVVLVMADRYEVLPAAMAAAYLNIPLAHAQGGEVSGNIDDKVRHAITKLADIHFPCTERSRDWIVRMGEDPSRVFLTGCPSTDMCEEIFGHAIPSFNVYDKYSGVGKNPDLSRGYVIVMLHPVTTEYGQAYHQAEETLKAVEGINKSVLWFWPNIDAGSDDTSKAIRVYREKNEASHIHFFRNMEPRDFLKILNESHCVIGNSSCGIREASYLGIPAVNIGTRQANRERAENVIDVDYKASEIRSAVLKQLEKGKYQKSLLYGDGKSGVKIADILYKADLTPHKVINYIYDPEIEKEFLKPIKHKVA